MPLFAEATLATGQGKRFQHGDLQIEPIGTKSDASGLARKFVGGQVQAVGSLR
jgi:hypothetical protein